MWLLGTTLSVGKDQLVNTFYSKSLFSIGKLKLVNNFYRKKSLSEYFLHQNFT